MMYVFIAILISTSSSFAAPTAGDAWLHQTTSDLLLRCQITSKITNGPLYTPDASASYGAQWTRDFAYMVDYAGDVLVANATFASKLQSAVLATLAGMRLHGCMPDPCDRLLVPPFP